MRKHQKFGVFYFNNALNSWFCVCVPAEKRVFSHPCSHSPNTADLQAWIPAHLTVLLLLFHLAWDLFAGPCIAARGRFFQANVFKLPNYHKHWVFPFKKQKKKKKKKGKFLHLR